MRFIIIFFLNILLERLHTSLENNLIQNFLENSGSTPFTLARILAIVSPQVGPSKVLSFLLRFIQILTMNVFYKSSIKYSTISLFKHPKNSSVISKEKIITLTFKSIIPYISAYYSLGYITGLHSGTIAIDFLDCILPSVIYRYIIYIQNYLKEMFFKFLQRFIYY